MAIDDRLKHILGEYEAEVVATPDHLVFDAALNAIPFVGSSIASLLSGKAQERVRERAAEVFREMKIRLDSLDEGAVRKDYFESEEFQTLLALAIEQLQISHDKGRLKMLAKVLVNSGVKEFEAETNKELFVRALRELSPAHIKLMAEFLPRRYPDGRIFPSSPRELGKHSSNRLLVHYPIALGFMEEISAIGDALERVKRASTQLAFASALNDVVSKASEKKYALSKVGSEFMAFLDIREVPSEPAS